MNRASTRRAVRSRCGGCGGFDFKLTKDNSGNPYMGCVRCIITLPPGTLEDIRREAARKFKVTPRALDFLRMAAGLPMKMKRATVMTGPDGLKALTAAGLVEWIGSRNEGRWGITATGRETLTRSEDRNG